MQLRFLSFINSLSKLITNGLNLLFKGLVWLFKGIWWIVSTPFIWMYKGFVKVYDFCCIPGGCFYTVVKAPIESCCESCNTCCCNPAESNYTSSSYGGGSQRSYIV